MGGLRIPKDYKPVLSVYQTQIAIGKVKRLFEDNLACALNLKRVSAPLFVEPRTGLNDNLNGFERPVEFDIPAINTNVQIVHSLAKWKRMALHRYGFPVGEGLYTDMNAIRRDEEPDNLHSVYVDQWDWEMIIGNENRTLCYLKDTVEKIVNAVCDTQDEVQKVFPALTGKLSKNVSFVTTQELEDMYPGLSPKERENTYTRQHRTVFIMQIGDKLKSGERHDGRAPDYDDWKLNGDILFWDDISGCAMEISSMGIRVDKEALDKQLTEAGCDERRTLEYHSMLLSGRLPQTIGGGIGQSRLCMLLLEKAHVGEVQVSVWSEEIAAECAEAGIVLL